MSVNVVNLDAMIPREDFSVDAGPSRATPIDKVTMAHLDGHYFSGDLRKPDFQRETIQWTPAKVVNLIRSFLDADLIPAVILWRSGRSIFVIDGAHRLSALLAWIFDDYGDRKRSIDYAGGRITDEQRKVAERTRQAVQKEIGAYSEYQAFKNNRDNAPEHLQKRLNNLADNCIIAQWVTATDAESAEKSFFRINQEASPIDPTERRLIKSRHSASAIAARAITHAGSGHKYWGDFTGEVQNSIVETASSIYHALYDPPLGPATVTTLDVPIAGRGYNALPFIFDFVNMANGVSVADTTTKRDVSDKLPADLDGSGTLSYLKKVRERVSRMTGDQSRSLGIHPVVYFYTRSGTFQPTALIAASQFIEDLAQRNKLIDFAKIRSQFENFLVIHKEAMSLISHKFGSGERSLPWLVSYYGEIAKGLWEGHSLLAIQMAFAANPDFAFLTAPRPSGVRETSTKAKHSFSSGTKTAAFFAAALPTGTRCKICGALVHKNSIEFDHIINARDGGSGDASNGQVSHPYCNSVKDHLIGFSPAPWVSSED